MESLAYPLIAHSMNMLVDIYHKDIGNIFKRFS